jgi:acyl-CoA synthetase (AMP-forming)/AMP-acid ligase II
MPPDELDLVTAPVALAAAYPDREAVVQGDRRFTWATFADRTGRLGRVLAGRGLGCHAERRSLERHRSGHDHVGIYLNNSAAGKPDYRWAAEIAADPDQDRPNERYEHV